MKKKTLAILYYENTFEQCYKLSKKLNKKYSYRYFYESNAAHHKTNSFYIFVFLI